MKKRIILPITLVSAMILGGCSLPENVKDFGSKVGSFTVDAAHKVGDFTVNAAHTVGDFFGNLFNKGGNTTNTTTTSGTSSTPDVVVNSVSITNKSVLTAEWFAGEGTRKVAVAADPEIEDINALLDSGALKITSSDPEVVTVARLMLSAKKAGKATITATLGGKSDSVEITVSAERTPIEIYGTVHAGTAEDPFDNADATKVGPLAKAAGDTNKYYVKGIVLSFYHAVGERSDGVVSWYLDNGSGGKGFECYKILKEDGKSLTNDDIWVGAEVVVKGALTDYNGQAETDTGIWVENTGKGAAKPQPQQTITSNVADAVTAGKALEDGASSYDKYEITGYVAISEGTNYWIADEKDSTAGKTDLFELYLGYFSGKYLNADGTETTSAAMLKNAKVKLTTTVKNYHGQIETGVVDGDITILEAGEAEAAPVASNVTDAVTAAYQLEAGASTQETYAVTGKIVSKKTWSDQYSNVDFVIADSETETDVTKQLTVFRYADKTVFDTLSVGDTVKVTSKLTRYVKGETDIIETLAKPTVELVAKADGGETGGETQTTNYGTVEAPISVTDALLIAATECATNNTWTAQQVYVKGIVKVQPDYSGSYIKTFYLKDETSEIMVYSCNKTNGVADPDQNDEVTLHGYITNYNGTIEFSTKDKTYYVTMDANTRGTSTVSVSDSSSADATVDVGTGKAVNGSEFTFSVTPAAGKQIDSVKVNGAVVTGEEGNYKVTVHGNMVITVATADVGSVQSQSETVSLAGGLTNDQKTAKVAVFEGTAASMTIEQKSATTAFRVNTTDGHVRIYTGYLVTFAQKAGYVVSSIDVKCADTSYATVFAGATYTAGSATSEGDTATLTLAEDGTVVLSLEAQTRVVSFTVTYTAA